MATSDDTAFEESSGTADSTVSYKYAQLVVPDYEFDVTSSTAAAPTFVTDGSEQGTRITSGSSFLRLGSFPALTDTSPSGFSNSVDLAKLVGDPSGISDSEDDIPDDGILRVEDAYVGDDNYLLGFADDTRVRDTTEQVLIAGQTCDNTNTARQQETKRLLTKGGWWDHSDGNRVTTTSGDKIEVIQGNYKMVVLGRRSPSDPDALGDHVTIGDLSGGNTVQQGIDPEGVCVEYSLNDGVWSILQSETGNQTAKFHGKMVDYFTGPVKESWIGKDPDQDEDPDNYPVITEKTWAKTISNYTGSLDEPIDTILDQVYAKAITEERFAAAINVVESAAEITETRTALVFETVVGSFTDTILGAKVEVHVGPRFQYHNFRDEIAAAKTEAAELKTTLNGITNAISVVTNDIRETHNYLAEDVQNLRDNLVDLTDRVIEVRSTTATVVDAGLQMGSLMLMLYEEVFLG